ncbi:unnamed protein product [Chrysoparadoxa australica]
MEESKESAAPAASPPAAPAASPPAPPAAPGKAARLERRKARLENRALRVERRKARIARMVEKKASKVERKKAKKARYVADSLWQCISLAESSFFLRSENKASRVEHNKARKAKKGHEDIPINATRMYENLLFRMVKFQSDGAMEVHTNPRLDKRLERFQPGGSDRDLLLRRLLCGYLMINLVFIRRQTAAGGAPVKLGTKNLRELKGKDKGDPELKKWREQVVQHTLSLTGEELGEDWKDSFGHHINSSFDDLMGEDRVLSTGVTLASLLDMKRGGAFWRANHIVKSCSMLCKHGFTPSFETLCGPIPDAVLNGYEEKKATFPMLPNMQVDEYTFVHLIHDLAEANKKQQRNQNQAAQPCGVMNGLREFKILINQAKSKDGKFFETAGCNQFTEKLLGLFKDDTLAGKGVQKRKAMEGHFSFEGAGKGTMKKMIHDAYDVKVSQIDSVVELLNTRIPGWDTLLLAELQQRHHDYIEQLSSGPAEPTLPPIENCEQTGSEEQDARRTALKGMADAIKPHISPKDFQMLAQALHYMELILLPHGKGHQRGKAPASLVMASGPSSEHVSSAVKGAKKSSAQPHLLEYGPLGKGVMALCIGRIAWAEEKKWRPELYVYGQVKPPNAFLAQRLDVKVFPGFWKHFSSDMKHMWVEEQERFQEVCSTFIPLSHSLYISLSLAGLCHHR